MNSKNTFDTDTVLAALDQAPAAGMKIDDLAARLGLDADARVPLHRLLTRLVELGSIARVDRGSYALVRRRPPGKALKAPDRKADKADEKVGKKADKKVGKHADEKAGKKAGMKADEKVGQKAPEKVGQKAPEKVGQKAPEKVGKKAGKKAAETGKTDRKVGNKTAETGKKAVETGKKVAETGKKVAETGKKVAETGKKVAETGKKAAKTDRKVGKKVAEKVGKKAAEKVGKKAAEKVGKKAAQAPVGKTAQAPIGKTAQASRKAAARIDSPAHVAAPAAASPRPARSGAGVPAHIEPELTRPERPSRKATRTPRARAQAAPAVESAQVELPLPVEAALALPAEVALPAALALVPAEPERLPEPETQPETRPETQPETRPEAQPETWPEARPAAPRPAAVPRPADAEALEPSRTGRITVHPAGYGFVEPEDGSDSVFVPARQRGSSLDGDRVVLELWQGYKGTEGRVVEILSRGRAKLTGVLQRAGHIVYIEPDDPRISTDYGRVSLVDGAPKSAIGQAAVIEICHYPTDVRPELEGRLLRVLGKPDDPRTEIEKIIAFADLPVEFGEEVHRCGEVVPGEVRTVDMVDRVDLRDRPFLTIDPETARDFDDALCIEDGPHGGPRVWIAVADVSHYVQADDPLDREAVVRGVSVYLPDRVIPMLPFPLSAGICSLNPEVDRCAMVVRLDLDRDGRIKERDFAAAVIRSHARLDYPGVAAALTGDFRGRRDSYRPWAPALRRLDALAQSMRKRRRARGALELTLSEARVILDQDDPALVRSVVRSKSADDVKQAYELVEEFMIAANEAVGGFFAERNLPTVWRVHAPPDPERLRDLVPVLGSFGIQLGEADVEAATTPVGLRRILDAIGEQPATSSLSYLVLRSLKQAVYDTQPIGHFGLASESYLHFTSPIRRYADLLVHRLLKYYLHLDGKPSGGGAHIPLAEVEVLTDLAATVSLHERRASEAEREAVAMYRAFLMREQVGEQFTGRITAVTNFGAFIEIDEPFVEGLIKLDALGADAFGFDAVSMRLRGRRSGVKLRLGDSVRVEVVDVSVARRRINMRLVSADGHAAPEAPEGFWQNAPGRRRQGGEQRPEQRSERRSGRGGRGERRSGRGAEPGLSGPTAPGATPGAAPGSGPASTPASGHASGPASGHGGRSQAQQQERGGRGRQDQRSERPGRQGKGRGGERRKGRRGRKR
jgi:ribonuclease R